MKIYNEVISIFNDVTGEWETISEDSFDYNGPMALTQGVPPNSSPIDTSDKISDTIKTTAGYFTDGDGTLAASAVHTSSLTDSNEKYYFNVAQAEPSSSRSEVQLSVTFGHSDGSGSDTYGDSTDNPNTLLGETEAIYRQFSQMLIAEPETSGGFKISAQGKSGVHFSDKSKDKYFYAIVAKRDKFKERVNKKNWTLELSGSDVLGSGSALTLTDDSKFVPAVATPAGPRYNIISGASGIPTGSRETYLDPSNGNIVEAFEDRTFGWFYPERGVFIFSGTELSASIGGGVTFGTSTITNVTASKTQPHHYSSSAGGFGTLLSLGDIVKFTSSSVNDGTVVMQVSGNAPTANVFTGSVYWTGTGGSTGGGLESDTGSLSIFPNSTNSLTASFSVVDGQIVSSSGFDPNLTGKANAFNALRMANCMRKGGGNSLTLRSEEDATEENYFCRITANEYNFTANPTFVSGSKNKIKNIGMHGNPTTFITGIGLWNTAGQLVAISSLSKPLKKNFVSEATIKVKLTY